MSALVLCPPVQVIPSPCVLPALHLTASLTVGSISLSGCRERFVWHYGFGLCCCFDLIILQELETKGRGHFPISLTQENMPASYLVSPVAAHAPKTVR